MHAPNSTAATHLHCFHSGQSTIIFPLARRRSSYSHASVLYSLPLFYPCALLWQTAFNDFVLHRRGSLLTKLLQGFYHVMQWPTPTYNTSYQPYWFLSPTNSLLKKSYIMEVQVGFTWGCMQQTFQMALRNCSEEAMGAIGLYRSFALQQDWVILMSKMWLKQIFQVRNTALFHVWKISSLRAYQLTLG